MVKRLILFAIVVVFASAVNSQDLESTSVDRLDLSVTVYNSNLGLVREVRRLVLPEGAISLRFQDVASRIDPTSVSVNVLGGLPRFEVFEQNYEFDLMSPEKLMEKYVGRTVKLIVKHPQTGKESSITAELLSMNGGAIYRVGEEIHIGHPGRVVLREIPDNLIARPTLVWLLGGEGGSGEIEVSYLTSGMGWKADYVALLGADDRTMDLTGWVTLTNTSGAGYEDASLKLVAGEVHRVRKEVPYSKMEGEGVMSALSLKAGFAEEPFFEYHLYTLARRTDLKDNQTKQVELLRSIDVNLSKEYILPARRVRYGRRSLIGEVKKEHPIVMVRFKNEEENGLGKPLPAGIFRFYKKDSGGNLQLVGEDQIDHVPRGEEITLKLGEAFDIVAERIQTDYDVISKGKVYEYEYRITLRNAKEEDITVRVIEEIPGDWEMLEFTHEPKKEAAHQVSFTVAVAPEKESVLGFRVRIR